MSARRASRAPDERTVTGSSESMHRLLVQKYGGSSLLDAAMIRKVAARLASNHDEGVSLVVVVSAMGNTTDELISLARIVSGPDSRPEPRELDTLLSTGELVTATLLAMAVAALGRPVISLSGVQAGIRTDSIHGSARIAAVDTDRLKRELGAGRIVIVAGFQGLADTEDVTTLGRGGSDTTAVALASALGADRCEIYTDVDGIYTADPRLVASARKLMEIGYEEMLEMAVLGAKMNPRSIEIAALHNVTLLVASSFQDTPGTLIHAGATAMEIGGRITGVPVERSIAKITVRGVRDRPGFAAGLFEPLAAAGVSVDVIVQNASEGGITDLSFTVSEAEAPRALEIARNSASVEKSEVVADLNLAKVSIVGTGMQNSPGYAARMFRTLADTGVNIEMIATSEIRITCVVDAARVATAVTALHTAFGLDADAG